MHSAIAPSGVPSKCSYFAAGTNANGELTDTKQLFSGPHHSDWVGGNLQLKLLNFPCNNTCEYTAVFAVSPQLVCILAVVILVFVILNITVFLLN